MHQDGILPDSGFQALAVAAVPCSAPTLSQEQLDVAGKLAAGVEGRERVQTLGGFAGSGKTTLIRTLNEWFPTAIVCAFTGKAANVLRRKGIDASTIHSAIYVPQNTKPVTFKLREALPRDTSCFIVDEASMVNEMIYRDLLSFRVPCVFVGDHGQLPPVDGKFNLMQNPQYRLEHIHRNAGEIPRFAEWLRHGKPATSFIPKDDSVKLVSYDDLTEEMVLAADQAIVAFNRTRVDWNTRIRALLGRTQPLEIGDRVMCLRNSSEYGLFNGMQGTVASVTWSNGLPEIDFDTYDGVYPKLTLDPDQFGKEKLDRDEHGNKNIHPFDYAYTITCHKAQGDEWSNVIVYEQRCDRLWEHKRWAYTAASRARESLTWILEGSTP